MDDYSQMSREQLLERMQTLETSSSGVALRESEERLRAILETAVEGIITIDERASIESMNPAAEKMFGYQTAEVLGKNVSVLMPSPYREEHDGYMHNYLTTGKRKIIGIGREVLGQRKDGSIFPMDLSVSEVRLAEKRLFTGFVRDITERKRSEEALRISRERFQVALKNSPITVFNQDANLRYTWIHNAPFSEPDRNVVGKTDGQLFSQDEADRLIQLKTWVLTTGHGIRQEVDWSVNGEKRTYDLTVEAVRDANDSITGIACAAMDITEHKRLEREVLQISEMEQRRIGQDLHDGICQHLAGIELMSEVLEQNLEKQSSAHAAQADKIAGHVRDVINQTRSLARGLSPVVLESEGMMAALGELAAGTSKMFGVECRFIFDEPLFVADLITATHLYRIAQEAVTNAIKHGKAKRIEISLSTTLDKLVLSVKDNGIGLQQTSDKSTGMGLRIMQYRAGMIGATLLIQKQPAGGTAVICFLPKPADKTQTLPQP